MGDEPSSQVLAQARAAVESRVRTHQALIKNARAIAKSSNFVLGSRALLRHVLLVGATGSGKTNHSFKVILDSVEVTGSVIVVDTKREYRFLPLDKGRLRVFSIGGEPRMLFNPLAPPRGVDSEHWDRAFSDVFTRTYGLSEPSRRIMLDSLFALRHELQDHPTLRELEKRISQFKAGSLKEQNSQRSLESRLHIINTGPVGASLNTEGTLDIGLLDGVATIFEIGEVDSLRDQRFLAELILLYLWQHDRAGAEEDSGELKRLIVVEEAHRYLSEERPLEQRGDRTLLELAIAEARRYGWGFLIIDQMPVLLSRYVWDNAGTVFFHRLTNRDSLERAWKVLVEDPLGRGSSLNVETMSTLLLSLPEDLAIYRRYGEEAPIQPSVGVTLVPRVK